MKLILADGLAVGEDPTDTVALGEGDGEAKQASSSASTLITASPIPVPGQQTVPRAVG